MTDRRYEWGRCAALLRKADYGLPSFVWWWPINWLILPIGVAAVATRNIWRSVFHHG